MPELKTFGAWFLLGAGLLISGSFAVVALRELRGNDEVRDFFILVAVLAISGGIFTGIVALAVQRIRLGLGSTASCANSQRGGEVIYIHDPAMQLPLMQSELKLHPFIFRQQDEPLHSSP